MRPRVSEAGSSIASSTVSLVASRSRRGVSLNAHNARDRHIGDYTNMVASRTLPEAQVPSLGVAGYSALHSCPRQP